MKRSIWTLAMVIVLGALLALPVVAAAPNVTKSVLGTEEGTSVVLIRVTATSDAIYGINVKDVSGSISDIVAPKGWLGISSGTEVLFRTGDKPIKAGTSLTFRIYTSNEGGELSVSFRDKDSVIGSGKTL
jgi:hypothetical protein